MANNLLHHEDFPKDLFQDTIPVLRMLHKHGLLTGVITATSLFSFEHDLKLHKIPRQLLDYTQTADDTPHHKPNPLVFEPVIALLTECGIKPEEVIYIGDGLHDMKAAVGAGFCFLGVETGLVTAAEFEDAGANSIADISKLL